MREINKKIYKRLKALEATNRFKVFSFNYNKRMPAGSAGFPDFVVLGYNGYVLFLEAKYGKDKMRDKQNDLYEFCKRAGINYKIIKEDSIEEVVDEILTNKGSRWELMEAKL